MERPVRASNRGEHRAGDADQGLDSGHLEHETPEPGAGRIQQGRTHKRRLRARAARSGTRAPRMRKVVTFRRQLREGARLLRSVRGWDRAKLGFYLGSNAISRILRIRVPRYDITLRLAKGLKMKVRTFSSQIGPYIEIYLDRVYERIPQFASAPGQTVLDIGANVGFYTVRQAAAVGPTGRVFSFEPNPSSYRRLLENVTSNSLTWVTCLPFAASSESGANVALYASDRGSSTASLFHDEMRTGSRSVNVETITLDDFVERFHVDRIDLLKLDAEGAEALAIEGGIKRALLRTDRIVMESHRTRHRVRRLLEPLGFELVLTDDKHHVQYYMRKAGSAPREEP
jgi:FkbM family methyltransferase